MGADLGESRDVSGAEDDCSRGMVIVCPAVLELVALKWAVGILVGGFELTFWS